MDRGQTWIEMAVENGGFREAVRAFRWAHSWIYVQIALGRDPSVDEVAEWWSESRRTAFREQASFRRCFPHLATPAPIYDYKGGRKAIARRVANLEKLEAAIRRLRRPPDHEILETGLLNPAS